MTPPLLLADAVAELFKVLVIVVFIVVPAIWQLIAKMRQAAQQVQPPRPVAPGQVQGEIDDFPRRAAQRRDRGLGGPPIGEPVEAVEAEVVPEDTEEPVGARVGRQEQRRFGARNSARRISQLGREAAQADVFDQRSRSVFGHEADRPAGKPGEAAVPPRSAGARPRERKEAVAAALATVGLFALLTEPENLRQAIVMSEILNRPEARWE